MYVKCSTWYDDNKFQAGVKDLEVMVQNVINTDFRNITSMEEGVAAARGVCSSSLPERYACTAVGLVGNPNKGVSALCNFMSLLVKVLSFF